MALIVGVPEPTLCRVLQVAMYGGRNAIPHR